MRNTLKLLFAVSFLLQCVDNTMSKTRNQYLRLYVYCKKCNIHKCVESASKLTKNRIGTAYNYVLSKYYDANVFYYSLSETDRELIEQILNVSY